MLSKKEGSSRAEDAFFTIVTIIVVLLVVMVLAVAFAFTWKAIMALVLVSAGGYTIISPKVAMPVQWKVMAGIALAGFGLIVAFWA
jgi:hypothetical protein